MGSPRGIAIPGLHKRTGLWGYAYGRTVYFDPQVDNQPGGNALMMHEWTHAEGHHAKIGIVVLVLSLGLLYLPWRRFAETVADRVAYRFFPREFMAFCLMHKHPTSWRGKFLYTKTPEERYERARRGSNG